MGAFSYVVKVRDTKLGEEITRDLENEHKDAIEFDSLKEALERFKEEVQTYANHENVAIEVLKYRYDADIHSDEYSEKEMGFYGKEAVKHLKPDDGPMWMYLKA